MMNLKNGKIKRFISCATLGAIMLAGLGSVSSVKALDQAAYTSLLNSFHQNRYSRNNDPAFFFQCLDRIIQAQTSIAASEQTPVAHFFPGCSTDSSFRFGDGSEARLEGDVSEDLIRGNLKPGMELGVYEFPDNSNKLLINIKRLVAVTGFSKSFINKKFHDAGYSITRPTPNDLEQIYDGYEDFHSTRHWTVRTKNAAPATAQLPSPIAPPQPPTLPAQPILVDSHQSDDFDASPSPSFAWQSPSFAWQSPVSGWPSPTSEWQSPTFDWLTDLNYPLYFGDTSS